MDGISTKSIKNKILTNEAFPKLVKTAILKMTTEKVKLLTKIGNSKLSENSKESSNQLTIPIPQ